MVRELIKDGDLRIFKFAFGWEAQNLEEHPIEWPFVQSDRSIATIDLWLHRLSWLQTAAPSCS